MPDTVMVLEVYSVETVASVTFVKVKASGVVSPWDSPRSTLPFFIAVTDADPR
jgi:hypothetical protein